VIRGRSSFPVVPALRDRCRPTNALGCQGQAAFVATILIV